MKTAAKDIGFKNPIGELSNLVRHTIQQIVGVIKDMGWFTL